MSLRMYHPVLTRMRGYLQGYTNSLLDAKAFYRLDEASGTRVDTTGRGNDLTDNNTVTQGGGRAGYAAQFTAANSEWLSHADNSDLAVGDLDWFLSVWLNPDSLVNMGLVCKQAATNPGMAVYYVASGDAMKLQIFNAAGSSVVLAQKFSVGLAIGTWMNIMAWYDSAAGQANISINNGTATTAGKSGTPGAGSGDFQIGRRQSTSEYVNGRIDEVGFWKRILTSTERTNLYNAGLAGVSWPFAGYA